MYLIEKAYLCTQLVPRVNKHTSSKIQITSHTILMELHELTAVSPVDGRYRSQTAVLADYFSEFALIRYRLKVEIEYFIALCEYPLPQLQHVDPAVFPALRSIYTGFTPEKAKRIKDIEKVTNHDVKAVEYYIKEEFDKEGLSTYKEFIHFGLTSQDINNTAVPMSLKAAMQEVYIPAIQQLSDRLAALASDWAEIPMLARTHGQPASPTRLGKEINVFLSRLNTQLELLKQVPFSGKFGGATGNFNAHTVAYPSVNWPEFGNRFLSGKLGIERESCTTQISNYDNLAALFDGMKRINSIILDLDRDFWLYISMEYFKQQIKPGEVGSSAMPHKVNPIDFENSEGNLGVANAIFDHLSAKLPVSRLQRDLTDSTVLRTVGVPLAHTLIAVKSTLKGLGKLLLNKAALEKDLSNNWAVVAEGIQTILRREGYPNPYEALKALTRTNEAITESSIRSFIEQLDVRESVREELRNITPDSYTGQL